MQQENAVNELVSDKWLGRAIEAGLKSADQILARECFFMLSNLCCKTEFATKFYTENKVFMETLLQKLEEGNRVTFPELCHIFYNMLSCFNKAFL